MSCDECGSNVYIVEYYNTEIDHETSLDIMSDKWARSNRDVLERVDCVRCTNMIIAPENL